jgi:phosphoesterase RecJ-like protein
MEFSEFTLRFKEVLNRYQSFLVMSHQRPDGDAVGSALAMGLALQGLGKSVTVWNDDPLPRKFGFLPDSKLWQVTPEKSPAFDAVISVDNANKERLGRALGLLGDVKAWINIDHHVSNEGFGDLNLIDPGSPATGEILFELFKACGFKVTPKIATSLFVAMSTDTGAFTYPGTTARSYRIAAELIDCGLKVGEISKKIYESYPLGRFLLMKRIVARTELRGADRISFSWIKPEDYAETEALSEDSEGLIDVIRAIDTVVVAVIFEALNDGKIRISLRSKDYKVDVNRVAQKFGGGGHPLAAGARIRGDPEKIQEEVLSTLEKCL